MGQQHPNVVALDYVAAVETNKGKRFGFKRRQLGAAANGRLLGCSHFEVDPGRTAWPAHWHAANEEAIFILAGEGEMRIGDARVAVRAGHYIALPPGPACAHQLTNTGSGPLRYLCFSTMNAPEVTTYPDSSKVGVMVGSAPGGKKQDRVFEGVFRRDGVVDYWDGEATEVP